ncbi:RagB/SusD family nutrient uptake outer membrane protein, partial [Bacteroidia bacterium]|nr:RagB/SusD family nutrient uptake outer membrane protein [Bacteroidia bacterium]
YGEILLIAAEAANELGDATSACGYLNQVRKRAGLNEFNSTDQLEIRKVIWEERRYELAFEHDRVFDLRRQGRIGEVLKANGINFVDNKHELYPIPQRQIDLAEGKMKQNPGY